MPTQHRASSGAWNQEDDRTLLALRAMGKNWNQIQREAFPGKTGNACRKRHERLMERRGQNDFDNRKLERLCKEYMSMRKEIWQPLASRCGEKWNVVEMQVCFSTHPTPLPPKSSAPLTRLCQLQCMSNGLKNIQSHARAYARRERLESGQPLTGYDDDSGLGGLTPIDDVDVDVADQSYSSPETGGPQSTPGASSGSGSGSGSAYLSQHHHHQQHQHHHGHQAVYAAAAAYGGYAPHHHQQHHHHHGHGYSNSVSSTGTAPGAGYGQGAGGSSSASTSPYLGHGNRLPSVGDMGIDGLLNRGPGGAGSGQL
jgi:hypothetical protein